MHCLKKRRTLREELDHLKQEKIKADNSKRKMWVKLILSLFLMLIGYKWNVLIYMMLFLLSIGLAHCLLAKHRFQKQKNYSKEQKQQELVIRTTAETMFLLYFIMFGLIVALYGCMRYVLHLPMGDFALKEWFRYSAVIFLLFEIAVLQFYRKMEGKV